MGADEKKVYDLVAKRFLAIFHPEAVFERTRVETTVAEHVFRTSGRRAARGRLERRSTAQEAGLADGPDDDTGGDQLLPKLEQGENVADAPRRVDAQGDPAAEAVHRSVAARARWRPRARTSRMPSCARR